MFQRIRRSFRKKKASVCINCGHVNAQCYHKEYENIKDLEQSKADHLKWLDLDFQDNTSVAVAPNNLKLLSISFAMSSIFSSLPSMAIDAS